MPIATPTASTSPGLCRRRTERSEGDFVGQVVNLSRMPEDRFSPRVAAQASGTASRASAAEKTNISTICGRPMASAPPRRKSPSWVPSTEPRKPAVPKMPTSSAILALGPRLETKVIEAPLMPATAQQYEIRSR